MPLDYSRFDAVGDSDSDGDKGDAQMGLADMLAALQKGSPPESPREVVHIEPDAIGAFDPASSMQGADAPPAPTLERYIELIQGAEATRGDDTLELQAAAKATIQSALTEGETDAAARLVQALANGLSHKPKPIPVAREQAPELVGEILWAATCGSAVSADAEHVLKLLVQHCRLQEVYTFVLEVLGGDDVPETARLRGIELLASALLAIDDSKRHNYLGSCLPVLLRKYTRAPEPGGVASFVSRVDVLRKFAMCFHDPSWDDAMGTDPAKVVSSMVSAFLFKVLHRAYAAVPIESLGPAPTPGGACSSTCPPPAAGVCAAQGEPGTDGVAVRPQSGARSGGGAISGGGRPTTTRPPRLALSLPLGNGADELLQACCAVARDAAESSPRPLLRLLEDLDIADPTGDGGGDLEISPLSVAAYVCLCELHGCWRELMPHVLPLAISAARRVNVLMRACYVLVANGSAASAAPTVLNLADVNPGDIDADGKATMGSQQTSSGSGGGSRWAHRGFALFTCGAVPLFGVASAQTPQAFAALSGPLCRWYPARVFQGLMEGLVTTPELEREVRGAIFFAVVEAERAFAWPCRFDLYLEIVRKCKVDSVIGALVTTFKDDWWPRVVAMSERGENLQDDRARLTKLFSATLSGDLQIVDGMDTLTGALNIARLVALSRTQVGAFMRAGLRKGGPGIDLDAMLARISSQIDAELNMIASGAAGNGLSAELARQLGKAMSGAEGGMDLEKMKNDRIAMVAHLVARVRELLAEAPDADADAAAATASGGSAAGPPAAALGDERK